MEKIRSFKQLTTWQKAHGLVLEVYEITRKFPKDELFVLVTQIRRCAISVTSNIAEGFSRRSVKEKTQFYFMALGSLTELENQLLLSRDIRYITIQRYGELEQLIITVQKLLNALIVSIQRKKLP